jgi:hypothetical protein
MDILLYTAYLPPIAYIAECLHHERLIIEAFESYPKQTSRNHCVIAGPNGKHLLSTPVIKVNGNHTLTKDIRIYNDQGWQKIHWRSIETAYNNSPFFLYYRDFFEPYFSKKHDFMLDLNTQLLETIFIILRIGKIIEYSDHFEKHLTKALDRRDDKDFVNTLTGLQFSPYTQVFENKYGFTPNLSIIDLIFNLGPDAIEYLIGSSFTTD